MHSFFFKLCKGIHVTLKYDLESDTDLKNITIKSSPRTNAGVLNVGVDLN